MGLGPVKASIEAIRQDFREQVPKLLGKAFSKEPTKEEWSRLHKVLGQIDMLVFGRDRSLELLRSSTERQAEISRLEEKIQGHSKQLAPRYLAKAKALARYLAKREVTSDHMQRNARAIAYLHGAGGIGTMPTEQLVEAIDQLTSLYAYEMLDEVTRKTVEGLAEREQDGMRTLAGYHARVRRLEAERLAEAVSGPDQDEMVQRARNNGWKGYVPATVRHGSRLVIADASRHEELLRAGYVKVSEYRADRREGHRGRLAVYRAQVAANGFDQGIAQSVHTTWQGVDARTNLSRTGETDGGVFDRRVEGIAQGALGGARDNLAPGNYLLPLFDYDGQVVGYERVERVFMLESVFSARRGFRGSLAFRSRIRRFCSECSERRLPAPGSAGVPT